ncbi:malto-oligosyltrehalose synthase [Enemella sp. A6]|uniref:malto-oligosyltrehalose synthase n=1 Tax=Enemella sp. A6 TaxID=3440152 RepID=UPI003EBFD9AC
MATPTSTYRLQIRPGFTLHDAAELVPYLARIGVGAVYLSPILTSTTGSDHGYDIVDPTAIDPQRGGEDGWRALRDAAAEAGLGIVIDIVPNHLGVGTPVENPSWWSVLREGRNSPYADWYDINWARGPILLPVLGDEVSAEDFAIEGDELHYHEHRFPLAEGSHDAGMPLSDVLDRQHYRLINWREGNEELTYRRFFAVAELAGVRVEDPEVFEATHAKIIELLSDETVVGVRVDHPDGLVSPGDYLARLRERAGQHRWLTAEKIVEPGEELPEWPIAGTTGYDAMREVCQVLIDPSDEPDFNRLYRDLTGDEQDLHTHVLDGKRQAARELLPTEARRIATLVAGGEDTDRAAMHRDRLVEALGELAAHVPVYRTYLPFGRQNLTTAAEGAKAARPDLTDEVDEIVAAVGEVGTEAQVRFEQFSGAVMAKGVEDTAWYRYSRFVALNEVGGEPDRFGIGVEDFHRLQQARLRDWPESMTSMSTHDTKRGEDVRARLAVLSEIDRPWEDFAAAFMARSRVPDRRFGYLMAQTLVAAGSIECERMHAYAEKAMREAATGTRWTDPDPHFEATVHALVDEAYEDPDLRDALARMWVVLEQPGWSNTLAQKVLQLTMPGVPDVYQGTELWDNALVDPDNRRPVNFADRASRLDWIEDAVGRGEEPPPVDASGNAKLWITAQTLRTRRDHADKFTGYTPVRAEGPGTDHLIGFDRGGVITLATRLPYRLAAAGGWCESAITLDGTWRDVFSGHEWSGRVQLKDLLHHYPVSLLVSSAS